MKWKREHDAVKLSLSLKSNGGGYLAVPVEISSPDGHVQKFHEVEDIFLSFKL